MQYVVDNGIAKSTFDWHDTITKTSFLSGDWSLWVSNIKITAAMYSEHAKYMSKMMKELKSHKFCEKE